MKLIGVILSISTLLCSCRCNKTSYHVAGMAYEDSCNVALWLATRNDPDTGNYDGVGYGDSRAASEDAHYHGNPRDYEGRGSEDMPKGREV